MCDSKLEIDSQRLYKQSKSIPAWSLNMMDLFTFVHMHWHRFTIFIMVVVVVVVFDYLNIPSHGSELLLLYIAFHALGTDNLCNF